MGPSSRPNRWPVTSPPWSPETRYPSLPNDTAFPYTSSSQFLVASQSQAATRSSSQGHSDVEVNDFSNWSPAHSHTSLDANADYLLSKGGGQYDGFDGEIAHYGPRMDPSRSQQPRRASNHISGTELIPIRALDFTRPRTTPSTPNSSFIHPSNGQHQGRAGDLVSRPLAMDRCQWLNTTVQALSTTSPVASSSISQGPPQAPASATLTRPRDTESGFDEPQPCKRGRYEEPQRLLTAQTREMGACIRCRRMKGRCIRDPTDPLAPCEACRYVDPTCLHISCNRGKILEVISFRTNTSEKDTWTRRPEIYSLRDIDGLASTGVKKLKLTHDWGLPLDVTVKPFKPAEGDETSYRWVDGSGGARELAMPHYVLDDVQSLGSGLRQYIDCNIDSYLLAHLDEHDWMLWTPIQLAIRRASLVKSDLLRQSLSLWMASRLIEEPWRICSDETLGMKPGYDPSNFLSYDRIPVTPVMDTQLDQVVIKCMLQPWRERVLKLLQTKIDKHRKEDWFEVFLALFIILISIEIATAHDHKFATSYGHVTPGRGSRFEDYRLIEAYFHSAQILIAHFRDHMHGHAPFLRDNVSDTDIANLAMLDQDEKDYLIKLRDHTAELEKVQTLKQEDRYESLLYWAHQLFGPEWDGSPVHIQELATAPQQIQVF